MSRERQEPIYKHLDMPVEFWEANTKHYVPPKTRDEAERERRHGLAPGTVILEQQQKGLRAAAFAFRLAKRADDVDYMTHVLERSLLAAAQYTSAKGAGALVQRRVLDLTDLTAIQPEYRRTTEGIRYDAAYMLGNAAAMTAKLIDVRQNPDRTAEFERLRRRTGRLTGSTAIALAAAGFGDHIIEIGGLSQADTQNLVRQRGMKLVEDTRSSAEEFGVAASIAQLADPYSSVSVHWHNDAPNGALHALEEAWDITGIAA